MSNNKFVPYSFCRDGSHHFTCFLYDTLFLTGGYGLSIPIRTFDFDMNDNKSAYYRCDVLVVKLNSEPDAFEDFVGFGDSELIMTNEHRLGSPFGNRPYTVGFTCEKKLRNSKYDNDLSDEFKWKRGDIISIEINTKDREIAFLRNHKMINYLCKKKYQNNLVLGVGGSSKGTLFHILRFGPVNSLEYPEQWKKLKEKHLL